MNQGRIIVITGAPGTGKTTTASAVAKESDLEKSVHMHTDDFYHYLSRISYDKILEYIKARFSTIFSYVSPDAKVLKNEAKNSPMFMLCFMMTNKSLAAQKLAAKLVKTIIKSTEKV